MRIEGWGIEMVLSTTSFGDKINVESGNGLVPLGNKLLTSANLFHLYYMVVLGPNYLIAYNRFKPCIHLRSKNYAVAKYSSYFY